MSRIEKIIKDSYQKKKMVYDKYITADIKYIIEFSFLYAFKHSGLLNEIEEVARENRLQDLLEFLGISVPTEILENETEDSTPAFLESIENQVQTHINHTDPLYNNKISVDVSETADPNPSTDVYMSNLHDKSIRDPENTSFEERSNSSFRSTKPNHSGYYDENTSESSLALTGLFIERSVSDKTENWYTNKGAVKEAIESSNLSNVEINNYKKPACSDYTLDRSYSHDSKKDDKTNRFLYSEDNLMTKRTPNLNNKVENFKKETFEKKISVKNSSSCDQENIVQEKEVSSITTINLDLTNPYGFANESYRYISTPMSSITFDNRKPQKEETTIVDIENTKEKKGVVEPRINSVHVMKKQFTADLSSFYNEEHQGFSATNTDLPKLKKKTNEKNTNSFLERFKKSINFFK